MNILHLHLSRDFAGSETYAADLATRQHVAGHRVALLVRHSPWVARWRAQAKGVGVLVLPRWAVGPLALWVAKHYAKGFAPQVLHSHLGRAHTLGQALGAGLEVPHVGTMHLRYKGPEHAPLAARIAIAQWQLAEVPEALRPRTTVVPNWVPLMPHPPVRKSTGRWVLGSVGRLHPNKGMAELVQAFKLAFTKAEDVALEIIGEGTERARLETLIGTDPRIRLRGHIPAAPCYPHWQAYVSAARYEPFGLTLLEAMQQHLPIVATRTQGATEIFGTQKTSQPFWAELEGQGRNSTVDIESLAKALRAAHAAHKPAEGWDMAPFDAARALAQIEAIYKEVQSA